MKSHQKLSSAVAREQAESLAIEALGFLAGDEDRLSRFLDLSGLNPQNLRVAAADPRFLLSVLEYLTTDETLLVTFAANAGRAPEDVGRAHSALGGGERG